MTNADNGAEPSAFKKLLTIKVFGVGGAGGNAVEQMARAGFADASFVVLNTDAQALGTSTVTEKIQLGPRLTHGLGAGGDPDVGRAAAEASLGALRKLCAGADMVFIATGLGGGTGTGASPVIARVAKEAGALVLGIATLPFDCEGRRRQEQARAGLELLKQEADGVICLPNQKVFKIIDENTSMLDTFRITNELLAQGVHSIWRMLAQTGMINIDFSDLCAVVRDRHAESSFAAAEAMGANRSREVVEKLLASPLLDGGQVLEEAETVLVSLLGGPDLTMAEVNRVMEQINRHCENAHIIMGAAIDQAFAERITVTLVAARKGAAAEKSLGELGRNVKPADGSDTQFLSPEIPAKPASRFVPPPPELSREKTEQLFTLQGSSPGRPRKRTSKMLQGSLPLEVVSKGRFEKSEPTIHKGEDLDVPTFIRRGVALN